MKFYVSTAFRELKEAVEIAKAADDLEAAQRGHQAAIDEGVFIRPAWARDVRE